MLHSWTIGDIQVTSIVEYFGPTHDPEFLFPAFDRSQFESAVRLLPRGHYASATDRLVVAIQTWLVRAGSRRILIDAGCGNGKARATARMNRLNSLWPEWFAASGETFDSITDVVMTHFHADHVGWNTRADADKWVPTFPNAVYHFPRKDFDWFDAAHKDGRMSDGGSFADSVQPVVDAGLVEFITDQDEIADCLKVAQAPGHSPGQLNYWLESDGQHGVFSADIFHSAVQIYCPEWNTAFCIEPENAIATRKAFLERAAETGALVMPCHFAPPHCGHVRATDGGYSFEPAAPGYFASAS